MIIADLEGAEFQVKNFQSILPMADAGYLQTGAVATGGGGMGGTCPPQIIGAPPPTNIMHTYIFFFAI